MTLLFQEKDPGNALNLFTTRSIISTRKQKSEQ